MSKKRRYRAISVNDERVGSVIEAVANQRVAIGIDIAKTRQFAAFMTADGRVHGTVRWEHPKESPRFIGLLGELVSGGCELETVMEPSGTYGDALRAAICAAGLPVYRVNPKRSHDAAEVYDGVPSLHDSKSAAIVAKLHFDGASEQWPVATEHERALAASLRVLEVFQKQFSAIATDSKDSSRATGPSCRGYWTWALPPSSSCSWSSAARRKPRAVEARLMR